jgi:hypothetical protein
VKVGDRVSEKHCGIGRVLAKKGGKYTVEFNDGYCDDFPRNEIELVVVTPPRHKPKKIGSITQVEDLKEGQTAEPEKDVRYRVYPIGEEPKAKWVLYVTRKGSEIWAVTVDRVHHRITNEGGWVIQPVFPEHPLFKSEIAHD